MKQPQKISGQIMVIVLLILSVVSIIALTITLATVRDTQEQVQNKQYQEYYSVGEKMLLDAQQNLGNNPLSMLDTLPAAGWTITSDADGRTKTGTCAKQTAATDLTYFCEFTNQTSAEVTTGSSETFDIHVEMVDSTKIKNQTLNKDQDLLIELDNTGNNPATLAWSGDGPAYVDWNISFDYVDSSNNYITRKLVYHNAAGGPYSGSAVTTDSCFSVTPVADPLNGIADGISSPKFITVQTTIAGCPGLTKQLYFRFKPVGGNASIGLDKTNGKIPLQRTIRTVTTSSTKNAAAAATSNEQNPTSVLETKYLLTKNPLSLFDYVLRTEQGVTKDQ